MHMLCIIVYNPLAVPLVYFLYSRGCGRHGFGRHCLWPSWFGRHSPPCGRHGLFGGRYRLWPSCIWPSLFVAVMDLAVIVFHVAVMVCGRHSRSPSSLLQTELSRLLFLTSGHSDAHGWTSECPDVKNTNDGLTRSGTRCFTSVPTWQQWASKG